MQRVFHDAVVDHLVRSPSELVATCSMVCVYRDDVLLTQESGALRIEGEVPEGFDDPDTGFEEGFDDASVLDLRVQDGVAHLLLAWECYTAKREGFHEYTRTLDEVSWTPDGGAAIALAGPGGEAMKGPITAASER